MTYLDLANFLTGTALVASAVFPLIMAHQVRIKRIRNLTYLLLAFLLLHGAYHLTWFFGNILPLHELLEPASVFAMIVFAVYLYQTTFPASALSKSKITTAIPVVSSAVLGTIVFQVDPGPDITVVALFLSFGLFFFMALKHPSIKSLYFQFTLFLGIWTISEIPFTLEQIGIANLFPYPNIGAAFHFASMLMLGIFVNYRFFGFWKGMREIDYQMSEKRNAS